MPCHTPSDPSAGSSLSSLVAATLRDESKSTEGESQDAAPLRLSALLAPQGPVSGLSAVLHQAVELVKQDEKETRAEDTTRATRGTTSGSASTSKWEGS